MAHVDYLLHECAVGYALFEVLHQADVVGNRSKAVLDSKDDLSRFGKTVQLVSFVPFQGAAQALDQANKLSAGLTSDQLRSFLELNLPRGSKKKKVILGVADRFLAGSIKALFPNVECETSDTNEVVQDTLRGLRNHATKLLKQLQEGDIGRAQRGLGHAYARGQVKFSVKKNDNHIIQAIATLDHLDKAINTFSMRVREWYSWHFPELIKIVSDNQQYARLVLFIGDKTSLTDDRHHDLAAMVNDDAAIAWNIINAARVSMGRDISESDMQNISAFAKRVSGLSAYRKSLHSYLVSKMSAVAPNLSALIGEVVGARLISHAGSLTNLAKYPASTVQILGAEKALFRALKTKGNTPKYGLIYHSSFIGRAGQKNKGRISRLLANKCSIASRIDKFSETSSTKFGEALRQQVEERLEFYASGAPPTKNEVVMTRAMDSVLAELYVVHPETEEDSDHDMMDIIPPEKKKKDKGHKSKQENDGAAADKKKKKKRKGDDTTTGVALPERMKKRKEEADVDPSDSTTEDDSEDALRDSSGPKQKKKKTEKADDWESDLADAADAAADGARGYGDHPDPRYSSSAPSKVKKAKSGSKGEKDQRKGLTRTEKRERKEKEGLALPPVADPGDSKQKTEKKRKREGRHDG
ncbi:MAG: snoRNP complex protein nop56 [Phylliscum demangeonii]|nr:MAG: snoRNP complex protein nop56 [Phylliscum demangeonii]